MSSGTAGPRTRIICLGNALYPPDRAGSAVYELLSEQELPPGTELVDGGLGGLNLLGYLENVETVIFVDNINGFIEPPGLMVLELPSAEIDPGDFGHQASLGYLMAVAPGVMDEPIPECYLVGIEGFAGTGLVSQAAERCLELATASANRNLQQS